MDGPLVAERVGRARSFRVAVDLDLARQEGLRDDPSPADRIASWNGAALGNLQAQSIASQRSGWAKAPTIGGPLPNGLMVQRSLVVGSAHDRLEAEADRFADAVIGGDSTRTDATATTMSPAPAGIHVQRCGSVPAGSCGCHSSGHRQGFDHPVPGGGSQTAPALVAAAVAGGSGDALSPRLRPQLENRVGADLASVRVHIDEAAARSASSI